MSTWEIVTANDDAYSFSNAYGEWEDAPWWTLKKLSSLQSNGTRTMTWPCATNHSSVTNTICIFYIFTSIKKKRASSSLRTVLLWKLQKKRNVDLEYMCDFIFALKLDHLTLYQQVDCSDTINPTWGKERGYFLSFYSNSVQIWILDFGSNLTLVLLLCFCFFVCFSLRSELWDLFFKLFSNQTFLGNAVGIFVSHSEAKLTLVPGDKNSKVLP